MTHQPSIGGMVCQRCTAAGALRHMAALPAQQHTAVAPAVQKQYALLPAGEIPLQLPAQNGADQARIPGTDLLPEIRHQHFRQSLPVIPLPQQDPVINSALRGPCRLHRRRGRPQHQRGPLAAAEKFRHVPGVIPGRILRLIAALLLLVQNNQSQVPQRRENGGAGAQNHLDLPPPDPLPLVIPLRHTQAAVEHGGPVSEIGEELPHHLRRQRDLRHQHHDISAPGQHLLHQPQIDLGLSAAGDALKQHRLRRGLLCQREDLVERGLLFPAQHNGRSRLCPLRKGETQRLLLGEGDQAALLQSPQCPHGRAGKVAHIGGGNPSGRGQKRDHLIPLGSGAPLRLHRGQGRLHRNRQLRHPAGPVADLPSGGGLTGNHAGLLETAKHSVSRSALPPPAYSTSSTGTACLTEAAMPSAVRRSICMSVSFQISRS